MRGPFSLTFQNSAHSIGAMVASRDSVARILFALLVALTLCGCTSLEDYTAQRTARLREMYPPGMSREEVQAKWGPQAKPDLSVTRPSGGWVTDTNSRFGSYMQKKEASVGKRIESVERYWGPDGLYSLAYCWYYYDENAKVVDVAWQYKSD